MSGTYVFEDTWKDERVRLAGLEAALDADTRRHLEATGVGPGWTCWEVGAGGGSVAAWLSHQVGSTGRVLATDRQTTILEELPDSNLEVLRHDVTVDPVPDTEFDLVHVRWLLHWLEKPFGALQRMAEALRPGGWLVAEEPDFVTLCESTAEPLAEVARAVVRHVADITGTVNARYGSTLVHDMLELGLVDVQTQGRVAMVRGGDASTGVEWLRLTLLKARAAITAGVMTPDRFDEAIRLLEDPRFTTMLPVTVAASGRRSM